MDNHIPSSGPAKAGLFLFALLQNKHIHSRVFYGRFEANVHTFLSLLPLQKLIGGLHYENRKTQKG